MSDQGAGEEAAAPTILTQARRWLRRILIAGLVVYSLITSLLVFEPFRSRLDHFFAENDATLIITSDIPIGSVRVIYSDRRAHAFPSMGEAFPTSRIIVPGLQTWRYEPGLTVDWTTWLGRDGISRVMRQTEPRFDCIYTLHLEPDGKPVTLEPDRPWSPFDKGCDFR